MEMIDLRAGGQWRVSLVPPTTGGVVVDFAASELGRYLELLSGEPLPVGAAGLIPLVLDLAPDTHLPEDAFTIAVAPGEIRLSSTTGRGVLYAVYALLEELGCLWVYPTSGEEIIPRRDRLTLAVGPRTHVPAIAHRGLTLHGLYAETADIGREMIDWMAKNRLNLILTSADRPDEPTRAQAMHWPEVAEALLPELRRRGMILEHSEHMTHLFFPPELFETHPEWFAQVDGRRQCKQMCFANADAVAFFAERLAEYAAAHPEVQVLGTWPLDGWGYCECDACQEPGVPFAAVCRMAERVERVNPDITVEYLAYTGVTLPVPAQPPRRNMSTLVCDQLGDLARAWTAHMRPGRGAYYFDYTVGDNYRWKANVWLRPDAAAATARAVRDAGYHGVVSLFIPIRAWWRSAFNTWFFARACWQDDLDVSAELGRYAQAYFGELHIAVRPLIDSVLYHLQCPVLYGAYHGDVDPLCREQDAGPTQSAVGEALEGLRQEAVLLGNDFVQLEQMASEAVRLRLRRWRLYVEYLAAYYNARSRDNRPLPLCDTPAPHDLVRWVAALPAECAMVNAPADFVDWRFDEFVARGQ